MNGLEFKPILRAIGLRRRATAESEKQLAEKYPVPATTAEERREERRALYADRKQENAENAVDRRRNQN